MTYIVNGSGAPVLNEFHIPGLEPLGKYQGNGWPEKWDTNPVLTALGTDALRGEPGWVDHREHRKTVEGTEFICHPYDHVLHDSQMFDDLRKLKAKGFRVSLSGNSGYYNGSSVEIRLLPPAADPCQLATRFAVWSGAREVSEVTAEGVERELSLILNPTLHELGRVAAVYAPWLIGVTEAPRYGRDAGKSEIKRYFDARTGEVLSKPTGQIEVILKEQLMPDLERAINALELRDRKSLNYMEKDNLRALKDLRKKCSRAVGSGVLSGVRSRLERQSRTIPSHDLVPVLEPGYIEVSSRWPNAA